MLGHRDRREPARVRARRLPRPPDHRRRSGGGHESRSASGSGSARPSACTSATAPSADEDLREALGAQAEALGSAGAGRGAAVHLQRPRLAHVRRPRPRRGGDRGRARRPDRRASSAPARSARSAAATSCTASRRRSPCSRRRPRLSRVASLLSATYDGDPSSPTSSRRALAEDLGAGDVTSEATVPGGGRRPRPDRAEAARRRVRARGRRRGLSPGRRRGASSGSRPRASGATRSPPRSRWSAARPGRCSPPSARRSTCSATCPGSRPSPRAYVDAVRGSEAAILDTRKTTPGLRALEKAAVAAGGGRNHRMGLDDAILIKENHIALAGGLRRGRRARRARPSPSSRSRSSAATPTRSPRRWPPAPTGCCSTTWTTGELRAAVARPRRRRGRAAERSRPPAGVTLDNVAEIAATGVDLISVGALTHSAPALDLSMLLEPPERLPARAAPDIVGGGGSNRG